MTTFRNTQQFKFGRAGELLASERLQKDGMFVVPTGEIEIGLKVPGYPGYPNGLDMIYFQCNQFRWISLTDLERDKLTPWRISTLIQTEICHYGDKFSEELTV